MPRIASRDLSLSPKYHQNRSLSNKIQLDHLDHSPYCREQRWVSIQGHFEVSLMTLRYTHKIPFTGTFSPFWSPLRERLNGGTPPLMVERHPKISAYSVKKFGGQISARLFWISAETIWRAVCTNFFCPKFLVINVVSF